MLPLSPLFPIIFLLVFPSTVKSVSDVKLDRINRHLGKINKPAMISIESPDGDTIDCVHHRRQPAFDHPLLKNHQLQRFPDELPANAGRWRVRNSTAPRRAWQTWHHVGHCPAGTIPIRRTSVADILRAESLYHYGRKPRRYPSAPTNASAAPAIFRGNGHEYAVAYTETGEGFYGAKATINVWDPYIQVANEFSLSQIWVVSGSYDQSDLNTIEAGWQVSPEIYGDTSPRLFIYWTRDAYQATGCYNLLCSGFIQTNSEVVIGGSISPVSSIGGEQIDITILIWKDPKQGNWWLKFGDDMPVGYWPAELFTHLANGATKVQWGGEIIDSRPNGRHTSTQMGSGLFAEEGFARSSYFDNLEVVDATNSLSPVLSVYTQSDNSHCYDIKSSSRSDGGTYFYYGGPGNNPYCP